jgi:glutamine amidotransferase
MIAIIDYGLGNIRAFMNVYKQLNIPVIIAKHPDHLKGAEKIILPGVGAFDYAMQRFNDSGMRKTVDELVLNKNVPIMGICVGMQMLAKSSEEGKLPGLGWIDAEVKRFDSSTFNHQTCIPHMGWNDVKPVEPTQLMQNLEQNARFYFLHSYYFHCNRQEDTIATTDYGIQFSSAVGFNKIYGVQFHPEKSHQWGIQLLKNFAEI